MIIAGFISKMRTKIGKFCFLSLLLLVPLASASMVEKSTPGEPVCLSRFDHDYKVIQQLAMLEIKQNELQETITSQQRTIEKVKDELAAVSDRPLNSDILAQFKVNSDRSLNGATYTRWGRTSCPGNATTMYSGYAAASHNTHSGGMANTICLPTEPQWGHFYNGQQATYIYGAEYEINDDQSNTIFGKPTLHQDVPCAVCQTRGRLNQMMIPARTECMDGWFIEYTGYLMTEHYTHHRSDVKCVDKDPDILVGQSANDNGVLFYFVEAAGQLPNPPYIQGRELTCVVCSQ